MDSRETAGHFQLVADRIVPWLPDWAQAFTAWLLQPLVLILLLGACVLLFVASLIGIPLVLTRMPADFFSRPERRRLKLADRKRPFWYVVVRVLRNALGGILFALGLVMLFSPGPGTPTMLVALFLLDFPGKRRLQRWIISRPTILRSVNALRKRASRPPLELPAPS